MKILFVTHDGVSHEPLGLEYVSAALQKAGHETTACEQTTARGTVRAWKPEFVAFQVISGDESRWGSVAAAVRWPWLYWIVRALIHVNLGRRLQNWIFDRTKNYINAREYWRVTLGEHVSRINSKSPLDRLGGELVRNPEKEACVG